MKKHRILSAVVMLLLFIGAFNVLLNALSSVDPSKNADTGHPRTERPASAERNDMDPVGSTAVRIKEAVVPAEPQKTDDITEALSEPPENTSNTDFIEKVSALVKTAEPADTASVTASARKSDPAGTQNNNPDPASTLKTTPDPAKEPVLSTDKPLNRSSVPKSEPKTPIENDSATQNRRIENSDSAAGAHTESPKTDPVSRQVEKKESREVSSSDTGSTSITTGSPTVTEIKETNPSVPETKKKKTATAKTETSTESPKCKHNWTWATHTETKIVPEVSHEVPVYNDGWDEAITVRKIYCSECQSIYEDLDDYYDHDFCFGSFGHMTVVDHYIHHEPELLFIDTIVDEPERKETVTVNDYQYCSLCGERK